jgi:hypothetical protein
MRHGLRLRFWPLLLVTLLSACEDDKPPGGTGGSGGSGGTGGTAGQDSGRDTGSSGSGGSGGEADAGATDTITPPPSDGGLAPCLDRPTDLDRPPSGQLPCDLLPPGFVAP